MSEAEGAMEWRDVGILLGVRRHGEANAIIDVLTAEHGRHSGLVRGGRSAAMQPVLQPGTSLSLEWGARLGDHLGIFKAEPLRQRAGQIMGDRLRLAGLNAVTGLLLAFLPEREPNGQVHEITERLMEQVAAGRPEWPANYARWEVALLGALGFPLDLSSCAATGQKRDLAYVSPRTGRAVGREAGGAWADRLLPLPAFLIGRGTITPGAVREALRMSAHFFETWACPAFDRPGLPEARVRLAQMLAEHAFEPIGPDALDEADEAAWNRLLRVEGRVRVQTRRVTY